MEENEICMFMDVKLDIHDKDKRASALRYKTWTHCQVKIQAIKCVPCFLRFNFHNESDLDDSMQQSKPFSVSVNVPGVRLSLATSRTKQHSYGLFWTQNRRDCFIYFALETDIACRRHMKWVKKSIKNLELYRQVFLEQRRLSRGPRAFGPLPTLPDSLDGSTLSSRVSQIYEEIFDGSCISRASVASGIYEEMKPSALIVAPPPIVPPPLPAHRKRINTFEQSGILGDIPRSNTNPESELAKKKKYKTMLDNIFGGVRQKRSTSASDPEHRQPTEIRAQYENVAITAAPPMLKRKSNLINSQRNSFSSPDLSKLNFLDTFGEAQIADLLQNNSDISNSELSVSLDESIIKLPATQPLGIVMQQKLLKSESLESLNVSEQLPLNFNFSACNSSTINLIGANGAVPHSKVKMQKNKILVDDLTGYCVMAPIVKKITVQIEKQPVPSAASTSSGYSTGSQSSSTNSCNNDEQQSKVISTRTQIIPVEQLVGPNECDIYERMQSSSLNSTEAAIPANNEFADHLYENLLAVKAAQELEQPLSYALSTSTPTESPLLPMLPQKGTPKQHSQANIGEEEDYYQTPRKSIISVDEKISSYYPNSCDTLKSKRRSPQSDNSPVLRHLVSAKLRRERKENLYMSSPQQIIDHRKQNSSTTTSSTSSSSTTSSNNIAKTKMQTKKTAAHKISEGVYAVTHSKRSSSNTMNTATNNNIVDNISTELHNRLDEELMQMAILQNIDFKFDDSKTPQSVTRVHMSENGGIPISTSIVQPKLEDEYEHCYQAAERATRLLQKYATLAKFGNSPTKSPSTQQQHQLQVNQTANIKAAHQTAVPSTAMTKSVATPTELQPSGIKKFASLPRFKKIDFSPLKLRLNNVLQRNQSPAPATFPE